MSKNSLGLVPAALLIAAAVAVAGDAPKIVLPWDGFGVGSWVTTKTTSKTELTMPGVPPMPAQTTEARQTLVKITDEAYTVKRETKVADAWEMAVEIPYPRVALVPPAAAKEVKPEELGKEKLTVDGTEIECRKLKTVSEGGTTITWVSEAHGMLKSETTMQGGGTTVTKVTSLAKKATVAGKDLSCREEVTKVEAPEMSTTVTHLTSTSVPGHQVRSETSTETKQMKMTTVEEVTGFEVK